MAPADVLAQMARHVDEICVAARLQAMRYVATRDALRTLAEAVDTARASFPPGSEGARVLEGALAGAHASARVILGVPTP